MKKIIAVILVTLACIMTLSSCALTTPDPLTLADTYDAEKCVVSIMFEDKVLAVSAAEVLKTKSIVPEIDASAVSHLVTVQLKGSEADPINYFYYFSSASDAKNAVEALYKFKDAVYIAAKEEAEAEAKAKAEEQAQKDGKEGPVEVKPEDIVVVDPYSDYVVIRQGKLVYFGIEECWDIAF